MVLLGPQLPPKGKYVKMLRFKILQAVVLNRNGQNILGTQTIKTKTIRGTSVLRGGSPGATRLIFGYAKASQRWPFKTTVS